MYKYVLSVFCCCLLPFGLPNPNCKGIQYSDTLSDDCKTLWICSNGTRQTIECKEGEVVGVDHTCISKDNAKLSCTQRALGIRQTRESKVTHRKLRQVASAAIDLLILLDSSGSIGRENFKKIKNNLAQFIGWMCPSSPEPFRSDIHRAALINFSTRVIEGFDFNTYTRTSDIQNAIRSQIYMAGRTNTKGAFEMALRMFTTQKGMRRNTRHIVLILSDGMNNVGDYRPALRRLKNANVKVYALTLGFVSPRVGLEIQDYASEPKDRYFLSFDEIFPILKMQMKYSPCVPFDLY